MYERYTILDQEVHTMCDKIKEDQISDNCAKTEELESRHKTKEMYQNVTEVTETESRRAENSCIKIKVGSDI